MRPVRWAAMFALAAPAVLPFSAGSGMEVQTGRSYVGVKNCKMCHSDVHASWQQKAHARAYDLLAAMKQEKNEKCLECHTTGYGEGGFTDADKTPDLKGVVCEACHGPGSEHNGRKENIVRTPSAAVCARCHLKASIH